MFTGSKMRLELPWTGISFAAGVLVTAAALKRKFPLFHNEAHLALGEHFVMPLPKPRAGQYVERRDQAFRKRRGGRGVRAAAVAQLKADQQRENEAAALDAHVNRAEGMTAGVMREFQVDDLVWEVADKPGADTSNFTATWKGPYKIISVMSPVSYLVMTLVGDAPPKKIHVDHLKPYRGPPAWVHHEPDVDVWDVVKRIQDQDPERFACEGSTQGNVATHKAWTITMHDEEGR
ncbi:hypothetical protein QBC46DRAFT_346025 [Diplogelasinospora grovesii]|uniref:Uncharacterized protein n=1 Tax=Diplogelasinospora grovesii TaxID=303347 RepID=A0AAN6S167_9PEZI|nr:hypothetical protein QBC46DRAFT_346025 [Diplogelasinospora grovesii]